MSSDKTTEDLNLAAHALVKNMLDNDNGVDALARLIDLFMKNAIEAAAKHQDRVGYLEYELNQANYKLNTLRKRAEFSEHLVEEIRTPGSRVIEDALKRARIAEEKLAEAEKARDVAMSTLSDAASDEADNVAEINELRAKVDTLTAQLLNAEERPLCGGTCREAEELASALSSLSKSRMEEVSDLRKRLEVACADWILSQKVVGTLESSLRITEQVRKNFADKLAEVEKERDQMGVALLARTSEADKERMRADCAEMNLDAARDDLRDTKAHLEIAYIRAKDAELKLATSSNAEARFYELTKTYEAAIEAIVKTEQEQKDLAAKLAEMEKNSEFKTFDEMRRQRNAANAKLTEVRGVAVKVRDKYYGTVVSEIGHSLIRIVGES